GAAEGADVAAASQPQEGIDDGLCCCVVLAICLADSRDHVGRGLVSQQVPDLRPRQHGRPVESCRYRRLLQCLNEITGGRGGADLLPARASVAGVGLLAQRQEVKGQRGRADRVDVGGTQLIGGGGQG